MEPAPDTTPVPVPEPLACSPEDAGRFLGGRSRRHVSRLIAAGKLIAKKDGSRTLIDMQSIRSYYASLPVVEGPNPLACSFAERRPSRRKRP
jgi:hypothetical protein